jgi:glycosyltransferase involved in cell wall biosynthesis
VYLIDTGIDFSKYAVAQNDDQFRVAFIGRIERPTKGIDYLIEVARIILRTGAPIFFDILGNGPGVPYGLTLEAIDAPVVLKEQINRESPTLWWDTFSLVTQPSQQVVLDRIPVSATPHAEVQQLSLSFNRTGPGSSELVGENPQAEATDEFYGAK